MPDGSSDLSNMDAAADEAKSLATIMGKYDAYLKPKENKVFTRYKFQCKVQ